MFKIEDFAFYGASGHQYIFQVNPIETELKVNYFINMNRSLIHNN